VAENISHPEFLNRLLLTFENNEKERVRNETYGNT
jgi:hypothetical protein